MPHSSEIGWADFSSKVAGISEAVLRILNDGKEQYEDMLEVYQYCGSDDTRMANLLFAGDPDLTSATADEISKTQDLKAAMQAINQLYNCMTNGTVSASDRAAVLRRMS